MKFTKMHGTGNDFIVLDAQGLKADWASLARRMCHRHFGVGADGIITVAPAPAGAIAMRMFNPDGSEAEACGNGLRCVGKFVVERGMAQGRELRVETLSGRKTLTPIMEGNKVRRVKVAMGAPRFRAEEIPVAAAGGKAPIINYPVKLNGQQLPLTFVNMGNPHAVLFLNQDPAAFPLEQLGPQVEHHPLFPQRINFEVVQVLGRDRVAARVWERGAGLTLSCGSGACAIAVAARLQGLVDSPVAVALPGGTLSIAWDGAGEVELTGAVAEVFTGEWSEEE